MEQPQELVGLLGGTEEERRFSGRLSYPDYLDLRDQNQVFSGLAAFQLTEVAFSTSESRHGGGNERGETVYGEIRVPATTSTSSGCERRSAGRSRRRRIERRAHTPSWC